MQSEPIKTKKRKKKKSPLSLAINTIIYIAIIGGIVWGIPTFLSWKLGTEYPIAAITSGSMWPVLKQGDLVFIKAVGKEDIAVDDIVVWQNSKGFTIHRVIELKENTLITKGDGNFTKDDPVLYSDVIGETLVFRDKPIRFPYLGFISMFGSRLQAKSGK